LVLVNLLMLVFDSDHFEGHFRDELRFYIVCIVQIDSVNNDKVVPVNFVLLVL